MKFNYNIIGNLFWRINKALNFRALLIKVAPAGIEPASSV